MNDDDMRYVCNCSCIFVINGNNGYDVYVYMFGYVYARVTYYMNIVRVYVYIYIYVCVCVVFFGVPCSLHDRELENLLFTGESYPGWRSLPHSGILMVTRQYSTMSG